MKTKQEIFDIVSTHLLNQMKQARQGEGGISGVCMYRNSEGLKCAVGCLVDDTNYDVAMEAAGSLCNFDSCRSVETMAGNGQRLVTMALLSNEIDLDDDDINALLIRLQTIHDNEQPRRWRTSLQIVAENYKLKFNHAEH